MFLIFKINLIIYKFQPSHFIIFLQFLKINLIKFGKNLFYANKR